MTGLVLSPQVDPQFPHPRSSFERSHRRGVDRAHPPAADAAAPELRAEIARAGPGVVVVSLAGEVDLASAHVVATALDGAVVAGGAGGRVVVELNRVTFLGARGLGLLLAAHATASRQSGAVVLVVDDVAPAARAVALFPVPGLHTCPSLTTALAAVPA